MGILALEELRLSNKKSAEFFEGWKDGGTSSTYRDYFKEWLTNLRVGLWRMAWVDQDELRFLQIWQKHLKAARIIIATKSCLKGQPILGEADTLIWPNNAYDYFKHYFSYESLYGIAFEDWGYGVVDGVYRAFIILKCIDYEIQRGMTITVIALKRYHLKFGKYPVNLQELVPNYLSDLQIDYMDGKPLRYFLNPDGTFTLYSIGVDGVDDHGNPASKHGTSYNTLFDGLDIVWPTRATMKEIEKLKEIK